MILVVDDEPLILEIFGCLIRDFHEEYQLANSGEEALKIATSQKIDVIVSDLKMPNMDGIELLEKVRQNGFYGPFIVVTAFGSRQESIRALRLGAFDFIDKPFNIEHMETLLQEALRISRQAESYLAKAQESFPMESTEADRKRIGQMVETSPTWKKPT